jgi:hypothetical protein
MGKSKTTERKSGEAVRVQRMVGWTNGRSLSSRYHGTPRFPLAIYRTQAEAKREFGLDAVRVGIVPYDAKQTRST